MKYNLVAELKEKTTKEGKKYRVLAIEIYPNVFKEEFLTEAEWALLGMKKGN